MNYASTRRGTPPPPSRSAATLEAERNYYAYKTQQLAAVAAQPQQSPQPPEPQFTQPRKRVPGASSSVLVPVMRTGQYPAANLRTAQFMPTGQRTAVHNRVLRAPALRRNMPVDNAAAVAVICMLAAYGVLVAVLVCSSSRPSPLHHSNDTAVRTPATTSAITPVVAAAPALPVPPALPVVTAPTAAPKAPALSVTPNATVAEAKPLSISRVVQAQELLRHAKADPATYRQKLAELVRNYSETPAATEALGLLAAESPAAPVLAAPAVSANVPVSAPAAKTDEAAESKKDENEPKTQPHYGLGLMD